VSTSEFPEALGIIREDVIIDCLALTVGADTFHVFTFHARPISHSFFSAGTPSAVQPRSW